MQKISRRRFFGLNAGFLLSTPFSFATSSPSSAWQTAAPVPISTQELYPTVHQSRLYVAGGIASKLGVPYFSDECYSYNPAEDAWRREADLPEAMHHAALVSTGERLFLVGGFNGGYSHIWRMRSAVYELTDLGWQKIGELPQPQAEGVLAVSPEGRVHLVTGQSPKSTANKERSDHKEVHTHLSWAPGESEWKRHVDIPTARNSATGAWVGNQLIVSGGRTSRGNLTTTEIYDLQADKWRTAAPLPLPQAGTASVAVEDGIIVFGGEIFVPESRVFGEVWLYSLSQDSWSRLPTMKTPRHGIGAGRFGDKVFVIGGATKPGGRGTSDLNEVLDLKGPDLNS